MTLLDGHPGVAVVAGDTGGQPGGHVVGATRVGGVVRRVEGGTGGGGGREVTVAGLEQDLAMAVDWYQKAASQGFMDAQANLGMMYYHGHGVERDYQAAARWFRMAADQGDEEARACLEEIARELPADGRKTVA